MSRPGGRHYKIPALAGALLFVLAGIVSFLLVPGMAHKKIVAALDDAGFQTSYIEKPQVAFGAMLYKDVKFDEYDFTTAKYIKVTFNPLTFLFTGRFKNLGIIDLNLTGDWADESPGSLSFSGWRIPAALAKIPFLAFRHISIRNCRVSLLTQSVGGISFFFDVETTRRNGKTEFQSSIKSQQRFLSFTGSASGVIDGPRWYADLEVTDGKFEDPSENIKATRMNGLFNLTYEGQGLLKIMGQAQAGGLLLYELPWQTASATLDFSGGDIKLFTEAKSLGYEEGLELEITLFKKGITPAAVSGMVHADQGSAFFEYFKGRKNYAGLLKNLALDKAAQNVDVDFLLQEKSIRYEIKKDPPGSGKSGEIILTTPEVKKN